MFLSVSPFFSHTTIQVSYRKASLRMSVLTSCSKVICLSVLQVTQYEAIMKFMDGKRKVSLFQTRQKRYIQQLQFNLPFINKNIVPLQNYFTINTLMSHSAQEVYNRNEIPLIEEDFFCQGQNVKLSLNQTAICIKTFHLVTVIKFTLDMEFELIYQQMTPIGLKIYTKLEKEVEGTMEAQNPESQEVQLFFYKYEWSRHLQWERALIMKCKRKGFSKGFQIIKKIGQGNFSEVYLSKQLSTGKIYAAKKIIKYRIENPKDKTALENQIKLLRLLDHQNIAKLYGVYEEEKILYLVLENVQGTSLEQYISQKKKENKANFNKDDTAIVMRQILKAVRYMSKKGVLHRDLKPQNILITPKKEIKIIDFNLATLAEQPKYLFVRCGTAGYVAPQILKIKDEQFDSCRLSTISDMFSIGTIFYKLIFNENLFTGSNSQIVKKNYKCVINFTDDMKKKMSPSEFELLARMLDPNPKTRITPTQALNHNYFQKFFVPRVPIGKQNYNENLTKFSSKSSKIYGRQDKDGKQKKTLAQTISQFGKSLFN